MVELARIESEWHRHRRYWIGAGIAAVALVALSAGRARLGGTLDRLARALDELGRFGPNDLAAAGMGALLVAQMWAQRRNRDD